MVKELKIGDKVMVPIQNSGTIKVMQKAVLIKIKDDEAIVMTINGKIINILLNTIENT